MKITTIKYVCDLCGKEIPDEDLQTKQEYLLPYWGKLSELDYLTLPKNQDIKVYLSPTKAMLCDKCAMEIRRVIKKLSKLE